MKILNASRLPTPSPTRRRLCAVIGSGVLAPGTGWGQTRERTFRLGWLGIASGRGEPYSVALTDRLRDLGFVEGRNLVVELRNAEGHLDKLPELVADLAKRKCDVVFVAGSEAGLAIARKTFLDTPIVIAAVDYDPVAAGHVQSLSRPGGNVTGISMMQSELPAKRLELMREILPGVRKIAVFTDPSSGGQLQVLKQAAGRVKQELHVIEFNRAPYDYEAAFAQAAKAKAGALIALSSSVFVTARNRIPELALKHRLPSIFGNTLWVQAGGLMSYAPDFSVAYRRAADQITKIFRGAKPAELPVEQPMDVELAINLKTAKALGITIPPSVRVRASRVVE